MKTDVTRKYSASIFWGVLLISFGLGYLLYNFKLMTLPNLEIQNLIGAVLILVGISLFKIPYYIKYLLNAACAFLIAWFLITCFPFGNFHWFKHFRNNSENTSYYHSQFSVKNLKNVTSSNLLVNAGAADIEISSTNSDLLSYNSTQSANKNIFTYDTLNSNFELNLELSKFNNHHNSTKVFLSDTVEWCINNDLGATDYNADFSNIKLKSAYFNTGASDITLEIGNKQLNTDLVFECSASDIEINIPKDAVCEVYSNTTLTDTNFDNFEEVNSGYFRSVNSTGVSNQKIKITISGSVSNFEINRK